MEIDNEEYDDLRGNQLIAWHYKHAQEHFKLMIESIEKCDMQRSMECLEAVADSLDITVDLNSIQDSIYAL